MEPTKAPEAPKASEARAPRPLRLHVDRRPRHPLTEPALFYDPPYATPAEDALAWHLIGQLRRACTLTPRAVVLTPRDCFRVNFLIEQPQDGAAEPLRLGLMCEDASAGSGAALEAPALHDALLVGTGAVDVLYRLRPQDARAHAGDLLFLMATWDAGLFDGRQHAEIVRRASATVRSAAVRPASSSVQVAYPAPLVDVQPGRIPKRPAPADELVVKRLSRRHPAAWTRDFEQALTFYDLAGEALEQRRARSA